MPPKTVDARVRKVAREDFGYADLRPGQLDAIKSVLENRDTFVVLPTGAGKSAIYQIAALLLDGPTVIVSPLIALQRDQVSALARRRITDGQAAAVNSSRDDAEATFEALKAGDLEFLFLSPEQLAKDDVVAAVAAAKPSLFVVDEAHCVSSWGHDFRPHYLRLGQVIEAVGRPTVLAMTATASPPVREEVIERLRLRDPALIVAGFDRPNIRLTVESFVDAEPKRDAVVLRAMAEPKPGLVYAATRKSAEDYADAIGALGLHAAAYHAGLRKPEREAVQAAFMSGSIDVVVATTAFGMGIDKADVRFVLHADPPDSLDAYYQELGRAGRDGEPAEAVLYWRPEDLGVRRFFASGIPSAARLRAVATVLQHAPGPVSLDDVAREMRQPKARLVGLVNLLEQAGAVEVDADARLFLTMEPDAAAKSARAVAERRREIERSRVEMVRGYAETPGCRRQLLLAYFGETLPKPCGRCDRCESGEVIASDVEESPYPLNSRVSHSDWGEGVVLRHEEGKLVVLFDDVGYKTLAVDTVIEHGLLEIV